jgi:hypothetical protein
MSHSKVKTSLEAERNKEAKGNIWPSRDKEGNANQNLKGANRVLLP